jgi:hypothetical protein
VEILPLFAALSMNTLPRLADRKELSEANVKLPIFILFLMSAAGLAGAADGCHLETNPKKLCANFSATRSLQNDSNVSEARESCEALYAEAIRALDLICSYKAEAATNTDNREIYVRYRDQAWLQMESVKKTWKKSSKDLVKLAKLGSRALKEELACDKNGITGSAPGLLLLGLAKVATEEQAETKTNILSLLRQFGTITDSAGTSAKRQKAKLKEIDNEVHGPGIPEHAGEHDATSAAKVELPEYDPNNLMLGPTMDVTSVGVEEMINATVSTVGGIAVKLLIAEKVDALTFMNIGAGMLVGVSGGSIAAVIGTGIAADWIESQIRKEWARKEAKIVDPYLAYILTIPDADSQTAATGYQSQKKILDYCKKCNNADLSVNYCPSRNSYNPNWYSEEDHKGHLQDWTISNPAQRRQNPAPIDPPNP